MFSIIIRHVGGNGKGCPRPPVPRPPSMSPRRRQHRHHHLVAETSGRGVACTGWWATSRVAFFHAAIRVCLAIFFAACVRVLCLVFRGRLCVLCVCIVCCVCICECVALLCLVGGTAPRCRVRAFRGCSASGNELVEVRRMPRASRSLGMFWLIYIIPGIFRMRVAVGVSWNCVGLFWSGLV